MAKYTDLVPLAGEQTAQVLTDLHRRHSLQAFGIVFRMLPQLHRWALGRALDWSRLEPSLSSAPLALDVESGIFLYLLARARGAKRIVELGTSTGVSTIYLALAARESGGIVLTSELVPEKVAQARKNVRAAGLAEYVQFLEGDARTTLEDIQGGVDFFHNDGFPRFALPVLQLLAPKMEPGAVTLCGNAALFPADHAEYLAWVREPRHGFVSAPLPMKVGGEFSIRAGECA